MTNGSKDVLEGHAHSRAEDSSQTVEPSRPRTRYNTHLESRWRKGWSVGSQRSEPAAHRRRPCGCGSVSLRVTSVNVQVSQVSKEGVYQNVCFGIRGNTKTAVLVIPPQRRMRMLRAPPRFSDRVPARSSTRMRLRPPASTPRESHSRER